MHVDSQVCSAQREPSFCLLVSLVTTPISMMGFLACFACLQIIGPIALSIFLETFMAAVVFDLYGNAGKGHGTRAMVGCR